MRDHGTFKKWELVGVSEVIGGYSWMGCFDPGLFSLSLLLGHHEMSNYLHHGFPTIICFLTKNSEFIQLCTETSKTESQSKTFLFVGWWFLLFSFNDGKLSSTRVWYHDSHCIVKENQGGRVCGDGKRVWAEGERKYGKKVIFIWYAYNNLPKWLQLLCMTNIY